MVLGQKDVTLECWHALCDDGLTCLSNLVHLVGFGLGPDSWYIGLFAYEKLRVHELYDSLFNDGLTILSNRDLF